VSNANTTSTNRPEIRVGLPYSSAGVLCQAAAGGATLISAGSLRRRSEAADGSREWRFAPIGLAAWRTRAALDSAGFVAMVQGGYRWSVSEYVEFVVTNSGDGSRPFPWEWWSAMDYCCEPEIAADRAEVLERVRLTVESYREHLEELDYWRHEGIDDVPDPLPILQGRRPADYVACAEALLDVLLENGRDGLPELVGIGSVCRRDLHGDEGLLGILDALHAALPDGVRLHLFGVKGDALPHLVERYGSRVAAIDSMAWDFRARKEARAAGISNTVEHRAEWLRHWRAAQIAKVDEAVARLEAAADEADLDDELEAADEQLELELNDSHPGATAPASNPGATMNPNETLETGEALALFDLGYEHASHLSTSGRNLSHPSAPDDVVVELLEARRFELSTDCASTCPRAAEVSAGAAAYLESLEPELDDQVDEALLVAGPAGYRYPVPVDVLASSVHVDGVAVSRVQFPDGDVRAVASRDLVSPTPAPAMTARELLGRVGVRALRCWSYFDGPGRPPAVAELGEPDALESLRRAALELDRNSDPGLEVGGLLELLACIVDPSGRSWSTVELEGEVVLVADDDLEVLEDRADDLEGLQLATHYTRRDRALELYRRRLELEHDLDDLVEYLDDRARFPVPYTIGQWCAGSCPSGAIYYSRQGDVDGPLVWSSPGWDLHAELPIQIDVGGVFIRTAWILVPWQGEPTLDRALYVAALRLVLNQLEQAELEVLS
jgi:hypothetical protein